MSPPVRSTRAAPEGIAIIGMGCRFPGAQGPETFWELMRNGVDAIREIPPDRPDLAALYDPRRIPGRIISRFGGFLENLDRFDAAFFGISPREAERLDPQQRLLLEVAWEALEDAGQVTGEIGGTDAGVFVGMWINDYEALMFTDPARVDFHMTTGSGRYSASGRLSYVFGLQGPSLTVDTACSSSLVAVHLACQALRNGECSLALAGGANIILAPQVSVAYSQAGMLSPAGRCRFGDAQGDGYVRSDGAGMVVLKPLSRALADGDPIQAVILGSAVNNDGQTSGFLTTPGRQGQEDLLRKAYREAGVDPARVQYVEAHGTGTSAGDPVELAALGRVLAPGRGPGEPCLVGSVKTNIGHTEGAAGVAGLIKVVLSLQRRAIPASLHFQKPNPAIPWSELPLAIPREITPWPPRPGPALAGVSGFGITGTNAHLVVEEAPPAPVAAGEVPGPWLLPISARSGGALKELAAAHRERLRSQPSPLADLTYTLSVRRTHHEHRLALVAREAEGAAERLDAFLRGEPAAGTAMSGPAPAGPPKVVFVFPGQGSQWLGMGRQILASEPVFRARLEACDRAVREESGFSILEELTADPAISRLGEIDVIQPLLFSIQVALAALWRSWGIEPAAVVGHSMGEVAASHVAGVLSLAEGVRVICRRSRLLRRTRGRGAMAVVELSLPEAREAIAGHEHLLSVAVSNSSRSTVLSGDPLALEELIAALEARDVFCRRVKVDVASHSPQMDVLRADLLEALESLSPRPGGLPLYSTVTEEIEDGTQMGAAYWVRNLREPVMFSTAVERLLRDGHTAFVEVSPHPILLPAIQQELQHLGGAAAVLASLRREEEERATLLESLGALYTLGCNVNWKALHPQGGRCVRLPSYPWQGERFWYERARSGGGRRTGPREGGHPLLGPHLASSTDAGAHFWETEFGVEPVPGLDDYRIDGRRVMPASAYVEMALAAAAEAFGGPPAALSAISFGSPLALPEASPVKVQVMIALEMPGAASFRISSLAPGGEGGAADWTLHAKGAIRLRPLRSEEGLVAEPRPSRGASTAGGEHYRAMATRGLAYGPSMQAVEEVWSGGGEAVGRVRVPESARGAGYCLHPALLDAGVQLLIAAAGAEVGAAGDETLVPAGLDHLRLAALPEPERGLRCQARLRPGSPTGRGAVVGDVILRDEEDRPVFEARGLRLQRLERSSQDLDRCFFTVEWEAAVREVGPTRRLGPARWLVFGGASPVVAKVAALLKELGDAVVTVSPGEAYAASPAGYIVNPERPEDLRRLLSEAGAGRPWRGVVHLWSLDAPAPTEGGAALREAQRLGIGSVSQVVEALVDEEGEPPRLWLVTAGTQRLSSVEDAPGLAQAPLWGLGRVLAREHPALRCTMVDLSPASGEAELRSLRDELRQDGSEDQVALRGGGRYVARLAARSTEGAAAPLGRAGARPEPASGRPYRAVIAKPGGLNHLGLRAAVRRAPSRGQVEIEVHTAGLNFMNVMSALGIHPAYEGGAGPLGLECAGRICAIGDAGGEMKLGDEVLAIAFDSLATHVLADAQLVAPRPSGLSLEDAATVPISFVTAHYALHHLARLQPGERVLIHAAAGGVGLAALQIAQQMGAEVFATAGSPDKREFLCSLGVRHVMDSRALTFADEVREMTGGEGVDVVLNSLAGEAASLSLKALRPFGRLVEIGPGHLRGNLAWPRAPFGSGLSYFAIDLDRMIRERPLYVGSLLREVVALFEQGILRPLPTRMFPVGELTEAFGYLAEARHRGKVAVRVEGEDPSITLEAGPIGEVSGGTYLITGLGDLSLLVARWLGSQGARHLAILDGNGPTPPAKEALDALSRGGVDVRLLQGDLADEGQLARALAEIGQTMPRLQGIVHAAGILDETKAGGPGQGPREAELARRLTGAWNLHALTASHPVDLFVLFSSASSLLGSPGQATQAAGDAFLDALVAHRRARGLSGLSVSWGPWSELGEADARAEGSRVPTAPGRTSAAPQRIPPELPHPDEAPLAAGGPRLEPLSNPSLRPLDECTYAVGWPRAEREPHQGRRREGTGRWLILADRGGVGRALAELLRGRGDGCVTLFADEAGSREGLEGLLREKWRPEGTPQRGVVHLWSLDAPALDEMTPESLETAHARGCGSVLHLLRALAPAGGPRLWLVTQGAQPAGRSPSARGLAQAPLWGLGRVLALEQPESWGGLVDLDPEGATDAAQRLVEEITQPDGEDQVAFCGRERRVARLIREPLAAPEPGRLSEGTYLVTGGLGGIGLQVARWLVERGARHLVLTSRAGLPERSRWDEAMGESERKRVEAVRELEALGASVTVTAADVTDPRAMTSLFQAFGRALPSLRGVVHAAGVMTVSGLTELEVPALLDVLRPKVAGAWVLHELTRELELDFFVLFSSAAAVWGSKGLGHYAAANHFLDALAHHRRARGRPALSVNWGWLSGGGMTSVETEAFFRRVGLQEMDSAQALGILGRLLGEGSVQKTVAAVDWDVFKSIYEAWGPRPLLQGLQTRLDLERDREPPCSCAGRAPMRAAHLNGCGLGSLNRGQALGALERIFRERPLQMAVMSFDLGHWRACHPTVPSAPLLTRLGQLPAPPAAGAEAGGPRRLGEALLAIEPGRLRRARLESHLREMVARVLKLPPARVDVNKPFRALGLDSLMALELRNRLEADLGLKLSATLVFNHPTVAALAPHLAECMGIPLEAPEATPVAVTAGEEAFARVLDEIEQMSVQEARRLLEEEHRPDEVGST